MVGAVGELLVVLVVLVAAVAVLRSLRRGYDAIAPAPPGPPPTWEPHVAAVDNQTVVSVRRAGARPGARAEVLEIARFPADDPDWHDKLVTARAEATLRATELNAPY